MLPLLITERTRIKKICATTSCVLFVIPYGCIIAGSYANIMLCNGC